MRVESKTMNHYRHFSIIRFRGADMLCLLKKNYDPKIQNITFIISELIDIISSK